MKRFAIIGFAVVSAVAFGFWWMVPKQAGGDRPSNALTVDVKEMILMRTDDGGVYINGKTLSFAIGGEEAKDVDVKTPSSFEFKDGKGSGVFQVTIRNGQPSVVTKEAYEKIQNGMTYPQVGEVLGGAMTKGKMSDGFSSKLELIQGKHQIDLTFVDGRVTKKSAKDLE
jgi:hypothetical protein